MNEAEELARRIGKLRPTFTLETGETGKAFGSITAQRYGHAHQERTWQRNRSPSSCRLSIRSKRPANMKWRSSCTTMWCANFKFTVKSTHPQQEHAKTEEPTEPVTQKRSFFRKKTEQNKCRVLKAPVTANLGKPRRAAGNGAGRGVPAENGGRVFPTSPTASSQDIHRTPPHSVEAEQGVLGSMLISPREIIAECVEKINEEYFYIPAHQTIYIDPGRTLERRAGDRSDYVHPGAARSECARDDRRRSICHESFHVRADSRQCRLLPRDRSRQIHFAADHRAPRPKACGAPTKSRMK